jgi:hypothetical protein
MRYTPEVVTNLEPNEVFVFGSNQYGRHGSGSALAALKFGAIYRVPMGLCGNTYGIITKSFNSMPCTLEFIGQQIDVLYEFAWLRQELTFLVTKIGTNLAGFTVEAIAQLFYQRAENMPPNIVLPKEFHKP